MCDFHMHVSLLAAGLKRSHVRLLAIDFDDTLLSLHTHSTWELGPSKLAAAVRPFFMELLPAVLRKGIIVSIVTFSSQRRLIHQTLREAFGQTVARQILIRGMDGSWTPTPNQCAPKSWHSCSRRGKTDHVLNIVSKIYADSDVEVTPEQVLLLDDSRLNVMQARYDGINAFQYDSSDPACGEADESNPLFQLLMSTFRSHPRKAGPYNVPAWATDANQSPVAPNKRKVHSDIHEAFPSGKPGLPCTGDDIPASVDDTVSLNSAELRDCWDTEELAIMDVPSGASSASSGRSNESNYSDSHRQQSAHSGSIYAQRVRGMKQQHACAASEPAQAEEWHDNPFARKTSRRQCVPRPDSCTLM
ncbi:Hypothetical Protein FCC1311_016382 [Hondaea fermentalgiana]|uniref:Uncharacterized protein n=1 Tax=Hondaea fermentalgiana TaxID=2315210 RepID=A0A2R5G334_9STRA|nr:Hypothetical Protein FCC1311_016382 [Hondaea fermentalgiana]|eukprot:GBG25420.1 Hypothetical Protein FCC1311_016382 [Hondaea fermentalgiana]